MGNRLVIRAVFLSNGRHRHGPRKCYGGLSGALLYRHPRVCVERPDGPQALAIGSRPRESAEYSYRFSPDTQVNMSYLFSIGKKVQTAKVAPVAPPASQPAPAPATEPEPLVSSALEAAIPMSFLSVNVSAEVAPQSTSTADEAIVELPIAADVLCDFTPAASEEQCASLPVPASTASSHTESSSE